MTDDLAFTDATDQAELVRTGQASPKELTEAAIARAERVDPQLNAIIHPFFDRAREEAAGELPEGPFRGVPLLLKDLNAATEGDPYHEGMRFLKDAGHVSSRTDELAARYLAAGFVYLGRTNAPELGLVPTTEPVAYGPTRNPWDTTRTTGGSSGGSAAMVAAGVVPVAHANDGGGSIRIPAACCGLFGLKPSRGRTPVGPASSVFTSPLNSELCVSRTVRDTAGVLDVLAGPGPGDTVTAPPPLRPYREEVGADPGRLHVGLLTTDLLGMGEVSDEMRAAVEDTAALMESLGHHVEPAHPAAYERAELVDLFTVQWAASVADDLRHWSTRVGRQVTEDDVEPLTWALAQMAEGVSAGQMLEAMHALTEYTNDVHAWWASGFDLLLMPTISEAPVPLGTFDSPADDPLTGFARAAAFVPFTPPSNVTGQPAMSVPLAWSDAGLPLASQLVAAYGRDDLLLRVAAQLEAARPWADRRPPVRG